MLFVHRHRLKLQSAVSSAEHSSVVSLSLIKLTAGSLFQFALVYFNYVHPTLALELSANSKDTGFGLQEWRSALC